MKRIYKSLIYLSDHPFMFCIFLIGEVIIFYILGFFISYINYNYDSFSLESVQLSRYWAFIDWSAVSAISALAAAVIALVTFAFQVHSLKRTLASSTYQNIVQQFNEYQRLMIDRPDLYKAIYKDQPHIHIHSEKVHQEVNWTLGLLFNWYENAAIQSDQYKIIPQHLANHWHKMLRHEMSFPVIRDYWDSHGDHYHSSLVKWVQMV